MIYYFIAISLIAAITTVFDKHRARIHGWRVPEATLFLLSLLGGSAAMFAVMLLIRHKTRHKRFMIGIPLIMIAQAVLIYILHKNYGIF